MKDSKNNGGAKRIADARFASFQTDPRYRLPSKKNTKTTIDKRFSRMLKDDEFTATSNIDRYGRKIKSDSRKKALQRLYREAEDEDEQGEDIEVEDDAVVQRELQKASEKYDPARGGGFSSSEDESGSEEDNSEEDDSEDEEGGVGLGAEGDMQKMQDEQADVEAGEVTNRIAIVNLDWDHVRSEDLMALFSSFIPPGKSGRIEKISVFPSEFGKERMQQEELEGPPKELFKDEGKDSDNDDSDEDSEEGDERIRNELMEEGDDQDFDSDALRKYQLDRLRYYYAIMTCSSPKTAQDIYEATDGTEYQSSSNFLDLRFVPEDITFDDEPRDVCQKVPDSYKPVEFVTNALQSSKVKLTWDMHPEEVSRKDAQKRAFSGSRAELEENDLKAYLASDSEESEASQEELQRPMGDGPEAKLSKKELARIKMREALGLAAEPEAKVSKNGTVGDMQVTFTPALSGNDKPEKAEGKEETTIEKYTRKERERKEMKRQKAKAKREGADQHSASDDDADGAAIGQAGDEDLGFDDPFFTTEDPAPASKTSIRKEERRKKREAREANEASSASERAHLAKIMKENGKAGQAEHLDHFDMNEIVRAEKQKKKKDKFKKGKRGDDSEQVGLQEGFEMNVGDDRFKAVFDSHEYAIDPSNPKFKGTGGMKKLLEEGRRKRKMGDLEAATHRKKKVKSK